MGQKFLADPAGYGAGYPVIANNSEEFSHADPVYIDSDGFLAVSGTTSKVLGYYVGQGKTYASDNETVAKLTPDYVYAAGVEMIFGADQACTQTDVGAYADMGTATTGAFELDLNSGGTGQYLVIGFDPDGDGSTSDVVVITAEDQVSAAAQT